MNRHQRSASSNARSPNSGACCWNCAARSSSRRRCTAQLAGDEHRLRTATPDQLNAAAAFLAKALVQLPDGKTRDLRRAEAIGRLEVAGKAISGELRRRAFMGDQK